jgi:PleD family two-component response regulator
MKLKAERQNPGARNQSGKSCRRARVSAACSSIFAYLRICSYDRAYTSDSARVKLGRCSVSVRVLLIDDSKAVVRELRSLLSRNPGWLVCGEGINGVEAVEKARSLRPDLILMDVSVPQMNGIEATRIIRREVPESAVILISQPDQSE